MELIGGTTRTHLLLIKTVCDPGLTEGKAQAGGGGRVRKESGEGLALGQAPEIKGFCSHACPDVRDSEREFMSIVPFHSHF